MKRVLPTLAALTLACGIFFAENCAWAESFERLLLASAQSGDIPGVQLALMNGARVDYQETSTGDIALLSAVRGKLPEVVALLLKFGANPNITNKKGESALPLVIEDPDTRIAKLLLRGGAYVPDLQIGDQNILLFTVRKGRFELAKLMIEQGHGSLGLRDSEGNNLAGVAILFATEFPYKEAETAEFIAWLRKRGLSFEESNSKQQSLMDLAIISGRQPVAMAVDWQQKHSEAIAAMTPLTPEERLELAVEKNDFETVRAQLKFAKVDAVEAKLNLSLCSLAIESNQLDLLELLARNGANLQRPNEKGLTPLALTLLKDNRPAAVILVNAGAKADRIEKSGSCPLFVACSSGKIEFVKVFATGGANLAVTNRSGLTALMCSVHSGNLELAKFLMQRGLDPLATNAKGQTAADIAASVGEIGMVRLLDKSNAHADLLAEFTPMPNDIHLGKWEATGEFAGQLALEFSPDGTGFFNVGTDKGRIVWKANPDYSAEIYVKQEDQSFRMDATYDFATTELVMDNGGQKVRLKQTTQPRAAAAEESAPRPNLRVKEKDPKSEARSGQLLGRIPDDILAAPGALQRLDLSYNRITSIDGIKACLVLEKLNLKNNRLLFLPDEIGDLPKLEVLDLSDNRLTVLPDRIGRLSKLKSLDLSNNGLQSLPATVWKTNSMENLDLSSNHLTEVPAVIPELTGLKTLSLANNGLYEVPGRLRSLTRLTVLDLNFNKISELPAELSHMTNLKLVRLAGNPIDEEQRKRLQRNFPRLAFQFEEESIAPPRASPPSFVIRGKTDALPMLPLKATKPEEKEKAKPSPSP